MKKIICFTLGLITMLSFNNACVFAEKEEVELSKTIQETKLDNPINDEKLSSEFYQIDDESTDDASSYEDYIRVIRDLEIMVGYEDGAFHPEREITRSEFTAIIVRILGMGDIAHNNSNKIFADIEQNEWYSKYITFAHEVGIVDGVTETEFYPNKVVTGYEAMKMLLCVLGYKSVAEMQGGYPYGYVNTGNSLKISKGLVIGDTNFTRGMAAKLIYNSLETDPANVEYITDSGTYLNEGKTILSAMNYEVKEGRFNAYYGADVTGSEHLLQRDEVIIDSDKYQIKSDDYEKLFASIVKIYYKENDNGDNVIYSMILSKKSKNEDRLNVTSNKIDEMTTLNKFVYYTDNEKTKSVDLPEGLIIIYNGEIPPTSRYNDDILKPENGSVTLIMNSVGEYEYAIVKSAQSYYVKFAKYPNIADACGNTLKIDEDEFDAITIYTESGEKTDFSYISEGDVLDVYTSYDEKSVAIYISKNTIQGTLSEIKSEKDEIEYIVESNGEEYRMQLLSEYSEGLKNGKINTVSLGDEALFYINNFNKIVYSDNIHKNRDMKYAYLMELYCDKGSEDSVFAKLLTKNNKFERIELSEKVIFGRLIDGIYQSKNVNSVEVYNELVTGENTARQIVKYAIDGSKIKRIYLADENSQTSEFSSCETRLNWYYKNGMLNDKYIINEDTTWIDIPYSGIYDDLLSCGAPSKFLRNGASYTLDLFDVKNDVVGAVVSWSSAGHFDTYETKVIIDKVNSPVMLIDEAGSRYFEEEGEIYNFVTGYVGGEYKTVPLSRELSANSNVLKDLQPGNIIQYETNYLDLTRAETSDDTEVMWLYSLLHDMNNDEIEPYILWNYMNIENIDSEICTMYGTVVNCNYPYVELDTGDRNQKLKLGVGNDTYKINGERYEKTDDVFICPGMKVFVRTRYKNVIEVVIVEE